MLSRNILTFVPIQTPHDSIYSRCTPKTNHQPPEFSNQEFLNIISLDPGDQLVYFYADSLFTIVSIIENQANQSKRSLQRTDIPLKGLHTAN